MATRYVGSPFIVHVLFAGKSPSVFWESRSGSSTRRKIRNRTVAPASLYAFVVRATSYHPVKYAMR